MSESLIKQSIMTPIQEEGGEGRRRRSSRSRRNSKIKSERSENTSVVIGTVEGLEKFEELLETIKNETGGVRSHYFRDHQNCGFVYFHDEDGATKAKAAWDGREFNGVTLKACAPLQYFDNELDALPIPQNSARRRSLESSAFEGAQRKASVASVGDIARTIVLKNLHFNMKQEKLLEFMGTLGIAPQSVNYHYDQNGTFRGVAFAKYKRPEDAARALDQLNGLEIQGRCVRAEFKKRGNDRTNSVSSLHKLNAIGGSMPLMSLNFQDCGEEFDPQNMDEEQKQIMVELQQFKATTVVQECAFPSSLTMGQRNQVHVIAEYLGLYHFTAGTGAGRYVVVSKVPLKQEEDNSRGMRNEPILGASFVLRRSSVGQGNNRLRRHSIQEEKSRTWPRESFAQPKGPDGSRGFAFGRGRRHDSLPSINRPRFGARQSSTPAGLVRASGKPPLNATRPSKVVPDNQ